MEKYRSIGTPINIMRLNEMNSLPTRNLHSPPLNGPKRSPGKPLPMNACPQAVLRRLPVGCVHIAQSRKRFGDKRPEYTLSQLAYDHELIFALGSFRDWEQR
jgi:hypothetical protein